tara:strand:- start:346 stop:807 length:462 start_codon:yes stop_codon:yes gene_type:complete
MKFSLATAFLTLTVFALSGCVTGYEQRIQQNPALYSKLSSRDKDLVSQGVIKEGMSKDAAFLAWGRPDIVREGSSGGSNSESWAYIGNAGVPRTSLSYANVHRPFYGRYGLHPRFGYCTGPGWGLSSGIDYVGFVEKTIRFSGNRVVAWERRR